MKVFFDHSVFSHAPYSGVSRYICRLADSLDAIDGIEPEIRAFLTNNELVGAVKARKTVWKTRDFPRFPRFAKPLNKVATAVVTQGRHYDVLHHSLYNPDISLTPFRAVVATSHDMMHELRPDLFPGSQTARLRKAVLARCDAIIAISASTKRDMVERFGYDERRITVVHHGAEAPLAVSPERLYSCPYLLFVGARGGYKNFARLLEALAALPTAFADLRLVAFGGGPLSEPERAEIARLGLAGRVIAAGGNDTALARHYSQAEALVYPSDYEGFGMPLLEAMTYGCPVISSDTSSLPEVGGAAAAYFDPARTEAMANAIARVIESRDLRQRMTADGRAWAAGFTWDKCARETLAVYRSVTGG